MCLKPHSLPAIASIKVNNCSVKPKKEVKDKKKKKKTYCVKP